MARNKRKYSDEEEEQRKKNTVEVVKSAVRNSNRPKNIRELAFVADQLFETKNIHELGISTITNLPGTIGAVQGFMKAVYW